MPAARLTTIDLPAFPPSELAPELPASIYPARVEHLRKRAAERAYDLLVVYADREHSAIDLHPDVLPLSNVPAVLSPFLLRPDLAMTVVG